MDGIHGREAIRQAWDTAKEQQEVPAPAEVSALLMAVLVKSLAPKAKREFLAKFQGLYDGTKDPKRRALVEAAAAWVDAPLRGAGLLTSSL